MALDASTPRVPTSVFHFHRTAPTNVNPRYVFSFQRNGTSASLFSFSAFFGSTALAGAAAGAVSRTVVSPLERLKIILQVQGANSSEYRGIIPSLAKMWREEGWRGFMRGNGVNVARILPYSAVQFSSYELAKGALSLDGKEMDTPRRLLAGSIAGLASCVSSYPLDLVRSRISIETASLRGSPAQAHSTGMIPMTIKVFRTEGGFRGLYRGLVPTAAGVVPYVAINFACYAALKDHFTVTAEDGTVISQPGALVQLLCGGTAGAFSQTMTYPLDVLRRRMQVVGVKSLGYNYKNGVDCIRTIIRKEGFFALYRGMLPNLIKVAPSIGVSFMVYEFVKGVADGDSWSA